jgi:hypothetical protein
LIVCGNVSARQATVLQIKVTVVDADQRERAIPRHALLISDNPATAAPRRVLTGLDGTARSRCALATTPSNPTSR